MSRAGRRMTTIAVAVKNFELQTVDTYCLVICLWKRDWIVVFGENPECWCPGVFLFFSLSRLLAFVWMTMNVSGQDMEVFAWNLDFEM